MVALPPEGGLWCDPSDQHSHDNSFDSDGNPVISDSAVGELDDSHCRTYRLHFFQSEQFNFCGLDDLMGPVVLSVKYYCDSDSTTSNHIRIVLRLTSWTTHRLVARQQPSPIAMARMVCPEISLASLQPVLCPKASELLLNYDEHVLVNNFKFGVIYQKVHQTSEEALFGNRNHSPAMDKFLDMIGRRAALSEHNGYRGGLDIQFGQTGQHSVYTEHMGKEVMYHVATLLPLSETDTQQLQRKRHIGNDIVSIGFQEGSTPFSPDMVTSHFLHAYIVVQPEPGDTDKYRVSVTARSDVPYFGPSLPSPPVFRIGPEFRKWMLNKLINAETACYRAERFSKLKQRTQATLLSNLVEDLASKTEEFIDCSEVENQVEMKKVETSFIKSVKKVIASRTKSQGLQESYKSLHIQTPTLIPKSKSSNGSFINNVKGNNKENRSRSHFGTDILEAVTDRKDILQRKLQSISPQYKDLNSRFTKDPEVGQDIIIAVAVEDKDALPMVSKLQQDVARLKVDKLELLRQNVAVQRELKR